MVESRDSSDEEPMRRKPYLVLDASLKDIRYLSIDSSREEQTVGRDPECDIQIINRATISRKHATILYKNKNWIVKNHSKNGTFINGNRVGEVEHLDDVVRPGNSISFAGIEYIFGILPVG